MKNRRLALLITVAFALAAIVVWIDGPAWLKQFAGEDQAQTNAPASSVVQPAAEAKGKPALLNPIATLGIEDFSDIMERPLFNPSRRNRLPTPPEVTVTPTETEAADVDVSDFTLLAVSSREEAKTAVVRQNSTNEVFHLIVGQTVSDWQVTQVSDREITLLQRGKTFKLRLFEAGAAQPAAP